MLHKLTFLALLIASSTLSSSAFAQTLPNSSLAAKIWYPLNFAYEMVTTMRPSEVARSGSDLRVCSELGTQIASLKQMNRDVLASFGDRDVSKDPLATSFVVLAMSINNTLTHLSEACDASALDRSQLLSNYKKLLRGVNSLYYIAAPQDISRVRHNAEHSMSAVELTEIFTLVENVSAIDSLNSRELTYPSQPQIGADSESTSQ